MSKLKLVILPLSLLIFLSGCFAIPIGDGKKVKLSKDGVTMINEDGEEASISLDTEGGSIHFTGMGDEEFKLGANLDLPEDFPDNVPIPEDANIVNSTTIDDLSMVLYGSGLSYDDLVAVYQEFYESNGFDKIDKKGLSFGMEDEGVDNHMTFMGKKGEQIVQILVTDLKDTRQVQISVGEDLEDLEE